MNALPVAMLRQVVMTSEYLVVTNDHFVLTCECLVVTNDDFSCSCFVLYLLCFGRPTLDL